MNKTAIRNFATEARKTLIDSVIRTAYEYGLTKDGNNKNYDKIKTENEVKQRDEFEKEIEEIGFDRAVEEVACTWFNRFIALRYMEVNNFLPSHTRVFSNEKGEFRPEVLDNAIDLNITGLERRKVLEMVQNNEREALYRYIIITQCNALSVSLPEMFGSAGEWKELFFPRNLTSKGSVVCRLVEEIPDEDWRDEVQIIGWLYQYYNSELKDAFFKSKAKATPETIPAATQLFTPDWIVRYMVENSLGRLWLNGHDKPKNADWKYFLEEAEQEESVKKELDKTRERYKNIRPEEIRLIEIKVQSLIQFSDSLAA